MSKAINILEKNNHLTIKEPYDKIVCGNSNYEIKFEFSEDWQNIDKKTAFFVVGDKKTAVNFSGSTVSVPALPNATLAKLVIVSADDESEKLVSSVVELNLAPTLVPETIEEFKPLSSYVQEILEKFEAIKNLDLGASNSEYAETAGHADTATKAESADYATSAGSATSAETATKAESADYATTAKSATKAETATKAESADFATTAGSATKADTATTAESADYATTAGSATSAETATKAESADYATSAESAIKADTATKAESADYATTAGSATSAETAKTAEVAESATKAETATKAESADFATTAETAQNASNTNLLINGNFQVNQRGDIIYMDPPQYTVDHWYITGSETTVAYSNSGVTLTGNTTGSNTFYQLIEEYTYLANKTITFSIKFSKNNDQFRIRINDTNGSTTSDYITDESGIVSVTRTIQPNIKQVKCVVVLDCTGEEMSVVINYAKLEIGSVATAFNPRPYTEEVSLCQRYYQKIMPSKAYGTLGMGMVVSVDDNDKATCNFVVPLCRELRADGTLKTKGSFQVQSTTTSTASSVKKDGTNGASVLITCTTPSLAAGTPVALRANTTSSYLALDSELY